MRVRGSVHAHAHAQRSTQERSGSGARAANQHRTELERQVTVQTALGAAGMHQNGPNRLGAISPYSKNMTYLWGAEPLAGYAGTREGQHTPTYITPGAVPEDASASGQHVMSHLLKNDPRSRDKSMNITPDDIELASHLISSAAYLAMLIRYLRQ